MPKTKADKSYLDQGLPEPLVITDRPRPRLSTAALLLVVVVSILFGTIGGAGGLLLLIRTGHLRQLPIPTTTTERFTVEESSAFIEAVDKVRPAVVSITVTEEVRDLFGRVVRAGGAGTGFIVTNDGFIVTNKHVVSDPAAQYTVFTNDGKSFAAKVVARDPLNDLAVIKIEASGLPVVDLGDSDDLKIGQWVIAIGNALGEFQNTVTVGVVSAKERRIQLDDGTILEGLLQTDAAINTGNSGGPLVNVAGQVVGINTALAGAAQGIGFAIPINAVKAVIDQAIKTGAIVRPFLGIAYRPVTKDLRGTFNLPVDYGVVVLQVVPGGPAAEAGIQPNDLITEVDGKPINENQSLVRLLQHYQPKDTVTLTVIRGRETLRVPVTLGKAK